MKFELISKGSRRLIILFAGWSTRPSLYREFARPGFDLMVVYDYTDFIFSPEESIGHYQEICVVAWSYGVAAAHRWLVSNPDIPLTRTLAVNGTPWPVDVSRGISPRVFDLTLRTLSDKSVGEFRRRMFKLGDSFPSFEDVDTGCLGHELEAISSLTCNAPAAQDSIGLWDKVVVSASDCIIPYDSQLNAWKGHPDIILTDWPHYPHWDTVLSMASVDKETVGRNFTHGAPTYDEEASVQRTMAQRLSDMWRRSSSGRIIRDAVEIGTGTGLFTRCYLSWLKGAELSFWDLADMGPDLPGRKKICDAELEIRSLPDASVDAISASASVQWFNSLRRFLEECGRVLRPGGQMVLSTFGRQTFRELEGIVSPSATYFGREELLTLMPDSLNPEIADGPSMTVEFESPSALLRHMSLTGVNTSSSGSIVAARTILKKGITTLTYHPVYAILTKK